MTATRPDTLARERANELVSSWTDGRPGDRSAACSGASAPSTRSGSRSASTSLEAPVDQEGVEAVGARPRDPDDGPHHARGEGHAGQGPRAVPARRCARCRATRRSRRSRRSASTRRSSPTAKEALKGRRVKVASVATGFPSGQTFRDIKLAETRGRRRGGRRRDRHGHRPRRVPRRATTRRSSTRSSTIKEACGDAHLKVILETGELETYDNVRRASRPGDGRRRRLHQDLDRQGQPGRDAAGRRS